MKKTHKLPSMRIFIFLLLTWLTQLPNASAQTITLSGNTIPMKEALRAFRAQSGYEVTISKALLESTKPVSIAADKMPLRDFLKAILANQQLEAKIEGKNVVITKSASTKQTPAEAKSNLRPVRESTQDTLIDVHGMVRDSTGQALANATVKLLDTDRITTTNGEGRFTLRQLKKHIMLEISYMGHKSLLVPVSARMNVMLAQDAVSMKEVVVTGLFQRKAESFTGSTATYTSEELLAVGSTNIISSLSNLDPSFRIVQNLEMGSNPNRLPDIQMRGQTGLPDLNNEYGANPNLPLFILDGFETNLQRVIDLDMYLVKSITLLKDAASKAVYGSRAANGVVVIETKMPPAGKLQVTYNYNLNLETPDLTSYNLTNAWEKLDVEMAADPVLNQPQQSGDALNTALMGYNEKRERILRGVDTYWLSQPLRNGYGQRHSVNVGGGTSEFRYNAELGYNNTVGVMKESGRQVYSAGMTLLYRFRKISVSNILRLSSTRGDNSPYGSFNHFVLLNPYEHLYDSQTGVFARTNPMYNGNIGVKDFTNSKLISNNLELIWQPLGELRINGRVGITQTADDTDVFLPAQHTSFPAIAEPDFSTGLGYYAPPQFANYGSYAKSAGNSRNLNATVMANYNKVIGIHNVYANIGLDANEAAQELFSFRVTGFPNPKLDFPAAAIRYAENTKLNGLEAINRDMGAYGSVNYVLNDRYLFDGTYRATRSSQFGNNDPWGKFWSAGIGWNLHHESFIKSLGWVDQLRLVANTGFTGTQALITNATLPTYSYNLAESYFNTLATTLQRLANSDLRAQRRQDHNVSLNAILMGNTLNIGVDYYIARTDGLLTDLNVPLSKGFSTYKANLGEAENRGFDFRINYNKSLNASKDNFVSFFVTSGHNKNTLKHISTSLIAFTSQQDGTESSKPKVRFAEGQSLNAIWAVPSLGIDPATGNEVFVKRDGTYTYEWDVADQIVVGEDLPLVFGNFGFSVRLSGWQFSSSFAYNFGGQRYNQTLVDRVENADIAAENVDRRVFSSRWRQPGDISMFKSIADLSPTYPTSRFVQNWNEISIAALNISYDLERFRIIRQWGFKRLRATALMNNPAVFSSIRLERGTEYPFARTFSFNLQTNF